MNGDEKRAHWNLKYEQGLPSLTKPDPFLVSAYERFAAPLFPHAGTALDVAAGVGRHALWLASKQWEVSAVDISEVAIAKLARTADQRHLALSVFAVDAADFAFAPPRFDLIVLFYLWDRSLLPKILSALHPGGLLISKLHVRWDAEAVADVPATHPLARNEFPALLSSMQTVSHHERPVRDRGVVEFVGRKPA